MYEYIKGPIHSLNPASVVIDISGIGYIINISLNTYSILAGKTDTELLIHQTIRDDAHILYGFATHNERNLFRSLITVSGVGTATAMMMLSSLSPDEITVAIIEGDANTLKTVKGIGIKTAQRIIIDLRDKLAKTTDSSQILVSTDNTQREEALSALVMLGFARKDIDKVISKIMKDNPSASVEQIIKTALKRL